MDEKPNLGLATTESLLNELRARIEVDYHSGGGGLQYTTVGGRPKVESHVTEATLPVYIPYRDHENGSADEVLARAKFDGKTMTIDLTEKFNETMVESILNGWRVVGFTLVSLPTTAKENKQ